MSDEELITRIEDDWAPCRPPERSKGGKRRGGMATIMRNSVKLAFEDRGAGKPAFVFVHG